MPKPHGTLVHAVPVSDWPEPDRFAWTAACQASVRLARGGAASHFAPVTQNDLAMRYGYFLDFLARAGRPLWAGMPADQVTPENVADYVNELEGRVASVTVYGSIYKLRRVTEIVAPHSELAWLREIEDELDFLKVPGSNYADLVLTPALAEAGLIMFQEAENMAGRIVPLSRRNQQRAERRRAKGAADRAMLNRAVLARDGVMVALLALCPIRLKNFAGLEIGRSLQKTADTWWIVLGECDPKTRRADERPVPDLLAGMIGRYVDYYRGILSRGRADPWSGSMWLSSQDGKPMTYGSVEGAVYRATELGLGIRIGPHAFRRAVATTAAVRAPGMPGLGSALLQHVDPRTTEQHYNRATAHGAAKAYLDVLRDQYPGW